MKQGTIIIIVMVLIITGATVYFYSITETYTEEVDIGFSGKARRNHFLALNILMNEMGDYAESTARLLYDEEEIYDVNGMLIPLEQIPADENKQQVLNEWIQSGGVLITGATSSYNSEEQVYLPQSTKDFLGIRKLEATEDKELDFTEGDIDVSFPIAFKMKVQGYVERIEKDGFFLAGVKYKGTSAILIFNSLKAFDNTNLPLSENANYIYDWFDRLGVSRVKIVYSGHSASIFKWLWNNAFVSIVLLFLFTLAWILKVTRRFGPTLPPVKHGSRKIMEHIEATGSYFWSGNLQVTLLKNMRKGIIERIKISYPAWLRNKTVHEELIKVTKLSKDEVEQAMEKVNSQINEEQFYSTVKILRKIKDSL